MQKKDIYFAVDCEMVGVGPEGLDSRLARVSIINWDNEIVLDTYVKVEEEVKDYRTFISGIRPEHIHSESAMSLNQVRAIVGNILNGKILVGHGLENDLKVMGIQHPWCDIRDTANYAPFMRTISKENDEKILCPRKLRDLVLENLNRKIQVIGKAHSSVEDAIAAMDLYKCARNKWEIQIMQEVNKAAKIPSRQRQQDCREPIETRHPIRRTAMGARVECDPGREPFETHHPIRRTAMGARVACDPGSQLLFTQPMSPHNVSQPHMPQVIIPVATLTNQQHNYHLTYHHGNPVAMRSNLATARRAQELARAKVVAALHQQRMRWQQQRN